MSSTLYVTVTIGVNKAGGNSVYSGEKVQISEHLERVLNAPTPDATIADATIRALEQAWMKLQERNNMPEWTDGDWILYKEDESAFSNWTSYERRDGEFVSYDPNGLVIMKTLNDAVLAENWIRGNIRPVVQSGHVVRGSV
jgi:hypothetical protein